ncbi:MAG: ATP-grasp domain-containing protein, partial [bacterium]
MNVVYLSPNFPPNYYQFILGLKNLGVNVFGIGEESYEDVSNELKYSLTEYYKVGSLEDYDQLLRAVAFFTHRYGKIDRVFSLNEYWLEKESMLRTDFNITGIKSDSIQVIKCKSKMKEKFISAGVAVARGEVVHDLEQAQQFIKKVGFPVVIKPDNGVGASNTFKINDPNELDSIFKRKYNNELIMEEFIDGDLYSFDGLLDKEGQIVFYTAHYYDTGIMQAVNEKKDLFCYSLREIPEDLKDAGEKTLKAFNVKETFFHLEYFRSKINNKIV